MAANPERQCVGCGRRAPQDTLVRLHLEGREGAEKKVVTVGRGLSGRGAYLCRQHACLDRALHRRAFQRVFRMTVTVDEEGIRAALVDGGGCGE